MYDYIGTTSIAVFLKTSFVDFDNKEQPMKSNIRVVDRYMLGTNREHFQGLKYKQNYFDYND